MGLDWSSGNRPGEVSLILALLVIVQAAQPWNVREVHKAPFRISNVVASSSGKIAISYYETGECRVLDSRGRLQKATRVSKLTHLAGFDGSDRLLTSIPLGTEPPSNIVSLREIGIQSVEIADGMVIVRYSGSVTILQNRRVALHLEDVFAESLVCASERENLVAVVKDNPTGAICKTYDLMTGKLIRTWKATLGTNPVRVGFGESSVTLLNGAVVFVGWAIGTDGMKTALPLGKPIRSGKSFINCVLVASDVETKLSSCIAAWFRHEDPNFEHFNEITSSRLATTAGHKSILFGFENNLLEISEYKTTLQ